MLVCPLRSAVSRGSVRTPLVLGLAVFVLAIVGWALLSKVKPDSATSQSPVSASAERAPQDAPAVDLAPPPVDPRPAAPVAVAEEPAPPAAPPRPPTMEENYAGKSPEELAFHYKALEKRLFERGKELAEERFARGQYEEETHPQGKGPKTENQPPFTLTTIRGGGEPNADGTFTYKIVSIDPATVPELLALVTERNWILEKLKEQGKLDLVR